MIQANILEQLETLFKIFITNQNVKLLSIISLVSLFGLILASLIKNKKITRIICILVYLGVFGTLFYFFHSEILTFLDYLMNNIFIFLFFPNLAIYTLVILIINILLIRSITKQDENKFKKIINIIFFVIFNIIFYLIIDNVIKNSINVYEQLSIYTNSNLLILIQLSMNLTILWLTILLIINLTSKLNSSFSYHRRTNIVFENNNNTLELESIDYVPENKILNSNVEKDSYVEIKKDDVIKNNYNDYIDIVPIKKKETTKEEKEILLSSMENLFDNNDVQINNKDMDILFGNNKSTLETILSDIEKLRYNQKDSNQIRKIYEEISLNKDELTLNDYNYLINALVSIKNNN